MSEKNVYAERMRPVAPRIVPRTSIFGVILDNPPPPFAIQGLLLAALSGQVSPITERCIQRKDARREGQERELEKAPTSMSAADSLLVGDHGQKLERNFSMIAALGMAFMIGEFDRRFFEFL
jgi:hypothetical protein